MQDTKHTIPSVWAKLIFIVLVSILEIHDMQMGIFPTRKLAIRAIANIALWELGDVVGVGGCSD